MPDSVPASADEFIRQCLHDRLQAVGQSFGGDVLTLVGGLFSGVDDLIRNAIEELREDRDKENDVSRLAFVLTTNGGYIEIVSRIVETLRYHYNHVSFIIPNFAFSAGTILALSGDEIHMDYYSRLGPIDPQVQNHRGRFVPALGYLKQWDRLLEKANDGKLTLAEANLMIDGFDQAELYQYEHARDLSVSLLKEWLVKYKFKNWSETETRHIPVTPKMKQNRAQEIGEQLNDTEMWHSHGRGISMATIHEKLNLKIDDLECDLDRHACVKQYYALLVDYIAKLGHECALHTARRFIPFDVSSVSE